MRLEPFSGCQTGSLGFLWKWPWACLLISWIAVSSTSAWCKCQLAASLMYIGDVSSPSRLRREIRAEEKYGETCSSSCVKSRGHYGAWYTRVGELRVWSRYPTCVYLTVYMYCKLHEWIGDWRARSKKYLNSLFLNYHIATLLEESWGTGSALLLPGHLALLARYKHLNPPATFDGRSFLVRFSWSLVSSGIRNSPSSNCCSFFPFLFSFCASCRACKSNCLFLLTIRVL